MNKNLTFILKKIEGKDNISLEKLGIDNVFPKGASISEIKKICPQLINFISCIYNDYIFNSVLLNMYFKTKKFPVYIPASSYWANIIYYLFQVKSSNYNI